MKAILAVIMMVMAVNANAATRNIVPRADAEGGIGTSSKEWGLLYVGSGTISGALYVGSHEAVDQVSTFTAIGGANIAGAVNIVGAVDIDGTTTMNSSVTVKAGALIAGVLVASDALYIGPALHKSTIAATTGNITIHDQLVVNGDVYQGAANYRSTFTASSGVTNFSGSTIWGLENAKSTMTAVGALYTAGGVTVGTTLNAIGATTLDSTLDVDGDEYHGAANFRSTHTAASGQFALGGAFLPKAKTLAELDALTGVVGALYYCSDCTNTSICIGSGTATGAFVDFSSPTVHCNTVK